MMIKRFHAVTLLAAMAIGSVGVAQAEGPEGRNDLSACVAGRPSILAQVHGFKSDVGIVRGQVYSGVAADFLEKGKWLRRVEAPRTREAVMTICLPVSSPGNYAIAIRHDANDNGKSDWNDGGGFSRNPRLSLLNLKPAHSDVVVTVPSNNPLKIDIVMQYRRGLTIAPLAPLSLPVVPGNKR
ncbi:MAG: DUF2141 domain-containing protein [Sphingobium sp.]